MKKTLSIIVPAYNVEKYLTKCLDSMVVKEILSNIEVLIINDGSKDQTAVIAQEYCNKYPETFFLYNKENGGHGSGINYGIKYATGKYFKVVDGDDWLNTENLVNFIKLLEEHEEDIIASDFLCVQDGTEAVLDKKYATTHKEQYNKMQSIDKGEVKEVIKMHSLTIRTELLQQNHVVIDEHCFYVDMEYITYPIPYADTVYYDNHFIYMYRLGRNGQSMDIKSMQRNKSQHLYVMNQLLEFYGALPKEISSAKKKYIKKAIGQLMDNQFQIYISMGLQKGIRKELKEWDRALKKQYPAVYAVTEKKSIWLLRKTDYWMLGIGSLVYKVVKG